MLFLTKIRESNTFFSDEDSQNEIGSSTSYDDEDIFPKITDSSGGTISDTAATKLDQYLQNVQVIILFNFHSVEKREICSLVKIRENVSLCKQRSGMAFAGKIFEIAFLRCKQDE